MRCADRNAYQSKTVETTLAELQVPNNPSLPPLMNPAMLEASEDLTNLSHLNEPAGKKRGRIAKRPSLTPCSSAGYQIAILTERNLYIQRNCADRNESLRQSRLALCPSDGTGVCREATCFPSAPSLRYRRGSFCVRVPLLYKISFEEPC